MLHRNATRGAQTGVTWGTDRCDVIQPDAEHDSDCGVLWLTEDDRKVGSGNKLTRGLRGKPTFRGHPFLQPPPVGPRGNGATGADIGVFLFFVFCSPSASRPQFQSSFFICNSQAHDKHTPFTALTPEVALSC